MWEYRANLVRVIDGDTYVLDIDLGFHITVRETIRLYGIDCPESSTPEGQRAREFAQEWFRRLPFGASIQTLRNPAGEVMTFARYVAKVYAQGLTPGSPGHDLAAMLRAAGHVKGQTSG